MNPNAKILDPAFEYTPSTHTDIRQTFARVVAQREYVESRVERIPESGCWIWMAAVQSKGYGSCHIKGAKESLAHRISWTVYRGFIPSGMCVLHRCDVPSCVNPDHLFLGTKHDNSQDMVGKGRHGNQKVAQCPQGHQYTNTNTIIDSYGRRRCRICIREQTRRRYERKKALGNR